MGYISEDAAGGGLTLGVNIPPASIGLHDAVLAEFALNPDYEVKGEKTTQAIMVFQVAEPIDLPGSEYHGKRHEVQIRKIYSFGPKSHLRKLLESWRGAPITVADMDANGRFKVSKLVGARASLVIGTHSAPDEKGRQFANDVTLSPPRPAKRDAAGNVTDPGNVLEVQDYTPLAEREKRWKEKQAAGSGAASAGAGGGAAQGQSASAQGNEVPF